MDLRKSIKKSNTIKMIKHKSKSLKSKSKKLSSSLSKTFKKLSKKLSRSLKNNCNNKNKNIKHKNNKPKINKKHNLKRKTNHKKRSLKKNKLNSKLNNNNMLGGSNCDKYAYVNEPGLEIESNNGIPGIKISPSRASIGEIKSCPTIDHPTV